MLPPVTSSRGVTLMAVTLTALPASATDDRLLAGDGTVDVTETRTLESYGIAGGVAATSGCTWVDGKFASTAGSHLRGATCLAWIAGLVWTAGVAEDSSAKRCASSVWRPGPGAVGTVASGTHKDNRCK